MFLENEEGKLRIYIIREEKGSTRGNPNHLLKKGEIYRIKAYDVLASLSVGRKRLDLFVRSSKRK